MPSEAVLKELQDLYLADDVAVPPEAASWSTEEAEAFFESGGTVRPSPHAQAAASAPPTGILRWIVDISKWAPKKSQWELLLKTLPQEDQTKVMKFKFEADQKRALVSRLLQRRASAETCGLKQSEVVIARTKGGKPYLANRPAGTAEALPNWNFNVSHEGDFVALAAEPLLLCGLDVAAPGQVRGKQRSLEEQFGVMKNSFTEFEWRSIRAAGPSERLMEDAFRKHWSLKEAFTKGRGDGLGFDFKKCEFTIEPLREAEHRGSAGQPVEVATVVAENVPQPLWRFYVQHAGADHWVSVSRGPPTDAIDALGGFKKTFHKPQPSEDDRREHLMRPEPPFESKRIEDLVPVEVLREYLRLATAG